MDLTQIAALLESLDKVALSIHTPALTIVGAVMAGVALVLRVLAGAMPAKVAAEAPSDPVTVAALEAAAPLKLVQDVAVPVAEKAVDSAVEKAVADALKL